MLVAGVCIGLGLCFSALAALWQALAALDGSRVTEQAMNIAPPQDTITAAIQRPQPAAQPASPPLPPSPSAPEYTPIAIKKIGKKTGDARVTLVRREILRCKPLLPFSKSTVTVQADPNGQTRILFSGHEARGDFGRCVGRVAARTRLARDERLAFKL